MRIIGIYKIENKINGKVYVGSAINIKNRWNKHKQRLKNNTHQNSHLQSSWNKHGEESFEHSLLQECLPEEIKSWEEYYIELYESYKQEKGYNIERISQGQKIVSEETKEKIKEKRAKQIITKEHRKAIGEGNKGRVVLEVTREKIANAQRGEKNHMFGKENKWGKHTEESKEKMRKSHLNVSDLTRQKMSDSAKGKHFGEKSSNAKLNWEKVREIRKKYTPYKHTIKMLAKEYGVAVRTINHIIHNETWKIENDPLFNNQFDNISKGEK